MKKLLRFAVLAIVTVFMTLSITSCDAKHCKGNSPYWCSSAQACCKYKYNDGKGTCFETLSGCTATGNGCETCWIED